LPASSSSSNPISEKQKKTQPAEKRDDEKPKAEYASARDEVKAIYLAKTGENPTFLLMDRIEVILVNKGNTFDDYLQLLRPHIPNTWKNPAGLLTHIAQTGFAGPGTPPEEKPKPKCPTCSADNQQGAILQNGAIVACPDCSTPAWREELARKLAKPRQRIVPARQFLLAEIARMQKKYPDTPFAKPLIDPRDVGDQGLIDRIFNELGASDEEYLLGFIEQITAKFRGWGLGGANKTEPPPGSETDPHSLGALVNWARDYARISDEKAKGPSADD